MKTKKEVISTSAAPPAIGPYSQGIRCGDYLFLSGQLPIDPVSGQITGDDIDAQTSLAISNIEAILNSAGLSLGNVVKTTVFLKNMEEFARMNGVYQKHFASSPPARSCVEVARLPKDARIEIESIAFAGS